MPAIRPPAQVLEAARANRYRPKVKFRTTIPTDPARAYRELVSIQERTAEHDAERIELKLPHDAVRNSGLGANSFAPNLQWKTSAVSLYASRAFRSTAQELDSVFLRYQILRLERAALYASVRDVCYSAKSKASRTTGSSSCTLLEASRRTFPGAGVLEFDAEASKSKLRKQTSGP